MIDFFSIEQKIETIGINPNTVYVFKNSEHSDNAPEHYHISIPISDTNSLLLVLTTSQVSKKKQHYRLREQLLRGLIEFDIGDLNFITKKCLIDCNNPLFKTKEELKNIILNEEIKFIDEVISPELVQKIKDKIKNSPLVKPNIKKLVI